MEPLFLKILNMSITASWLVLAIIAVRLIFSKAPRWVLCLLWGLVAFRLICPFSIESSLSLIPDPEPLSRETAYPSETGKPAQGEILDSEGNEIAQRNPATHGDILDSEENVIVEVKDGHRLYPDETPAHGWMFYLSRIWFVGIGAMLVYAAVSFYLLKRKVATAIPLKHGIKQSENVDSPFVLGIFYPVIYLPFDMEERDMAYVLAHEKAHINRRDHWWKPLGFLLLSVHWFNPVIWAGYILLCRDIEAACDERVIRNMSKEELRAYSTALLNCSIHRRRIAACPLAFGETGVKARVTHVMHYKKPAFWLVIAALIVVIVFGVCFLTNPESGNEDPVEILDLLDYSAPGVFTWFNNLDPIPGDAAYEDQPIPLGGMDNVSLFYNQSEGYLRLMTSGNSTKLFSGVHVWNLFLSDLNADGVQEICATTRPDALDRVYILDYANDQTYELAETQEHFYRLTNREDTLFVLQYDLNFNVVGYGLPVLKDGTIELAPLDERYRHLTETVTCVDINNRKLVCLSEPDEIENMISILDQIRLQQTSVPVEGWEKANAQSYRNTNIVQINYGLGQKTFHFSEDFSLYLDAEENTAFRVKDPEPIRAYVSQATNGVIKQQVSGEPFATMDTPWDWCKNITIQAVETARLEVTYNVTSGSATGTSGIMPQETVEAFARIVNAIPKSAFTSYESMEKMSFSSFVSGPTALKSGISILDGVNQLAVGFVYCNDEVRMVLTEETEQFNRGNPFYMTSCRTWKVNDSRLKDFMQRLIEDRPVITYTVGAEYTWQAPLSFAADGFKLELNLIEGWEYEYVTTEDSSGIRVRPEGEKSGWIYFSYWPDGYQPVETDRYLSEGWSFGYPTYTSYPAAVKTPTSFSTYHQSWSYRRYDLDFGDFAVINDGADSWFLAYEDQISCIDTLARFQSNP